jgi:hypothetical protein
MVQFMLAEKAARQLTVHPINGPRTKDLLDREKFTGAVLYLWVFQYFVK